MEVPEIRSTVSWSSFMHLSLEHRRVVLGLWMSQNTKKICLFVLAFFWVLIFCFLQYKHWMHFKMIFSCWKKIKNKYFCCVVYNNNIIINLLQCIYYGLNSTGSSFFILNIEETFSFYFFCFWFWSYPACVKMFSLPTHRNKLKCIAYNQCWDFIEMMIFTYPPSPPFPLALPG